MRVVLLYGWVLTVLLGCRLVQARSDDDLARKINEIILALDYKQASWGILFVDAKTGKPIFARNPDHLFTPASTTKLYSCAAAVAILGPDFRFETPVYTRGELKNGILQGDLILVSSGDLTMGGRNKDGKIVFVNNDHTYANGGLGNAELTDTNPLFGLESLAKQVAKSGIREVRGEVMVDERLFERAQGSGSGPDLISPIVVNDNVLDVIVTPGAKAGDAAKVEFRPKTEFMQMDAVVETTEKDKGASITLRPAGSHHFSVRGRVSVGMKPQVRIYPINEPMLFARALFIEALRREGVRVNAVLTEPARFDLPPRDTYTVFPQVASFRSPPLSEVTTVTLKVSHNLYASTLPLLLAAKHQERTLNLGLRRQGAFLKEVGVPVDTISFAGGAGGSNADAVTPSATVQLLQGMAKRPEWKVYEAGFPILGVDGTLAESVPADSPAKGKVRAKTGTLSWYDALNDRTLLRSKALAGTMETASGKQLYFAMFVNNVPLPKETPTSREGKVLGKICEIVYQNAR